MSATLDDLPAPIDPLEGLDPERREAVIRFAREGMPNLREMIEAMVELEPYADDPRVAARLVECGELIEEVARDVNYLMAVHPEMLAVRELKENARRCLAEGMPPEDVRARFVAALDEHIVRPERQGFRLAMTMALDAVLIESTPPLEA